MRARFDTVRDTIKVVASPQFTRNLFGPMRAVAGQELEVESVNPNGSVTCFVLGRYLVEVDARDVDIAPVAAHSPGN